MRRTREQIRAAAAKKRDDETRRKADAKAEREAKKASKAAEKPAGKRYAEAYAEGQRDASGEEYPIPTAVAVFWPILKAKAIGKDGKPLVGDELLTWIRASSAEYRRARASNAYFEWGFCPRKWAEWLMSGKAAAPAFGRGPSTRQAAPTDGSSWRQARAVEVG